MTKSCAPTWAILVRLDEARKVSESFAGNSSEKEYVVMPIKPLSA
jgi:hypothetical protein